MKVIFLFYFKTETTTTKLYVKNSGVFIQKFLTKQQK